MTRKTLCFATLTALALALLAPAPAQADDHGRSGGWSRGGGHGNGHGHGGGHGGGHGNGHYQPYYRPYYKPYYQSYYRGGYYGYPRAGYVSRWGAPYYYGAGAWYRPYRPQFVVVGAPLGVVVPYLPPYYSTVVVGGAPYYCADNTYYQQVAGGYAVVPAPQGMPMQPEAGYGSSVDEELFIYPERGQNESRQSDDRYECHRWSVDQTGFDPTRALEGVQDDGGGSRSDYQRAMTACLTGRGYSVR